ncbi:MAG TPA: MinD/ParA family protein [Bacillota bacterium]
MTDQAERLREIIKGHTKQVNLARVIAVTSGKGGVGKTNFSVNLGIALSKLGNRVLLVDADLGMANADMIMGVVPKYHLGHIVSGQKSLREVIVEGNAGLRLLSGGSGDYRMANLSERSLENCLQRLNELEGETDIMLIDTGAGISRNVLKFVLAAGEVVVITTPEPTAVTDAYGIIKVVTNADANIPIWVVVNMVRNAAEGRQVTERLAAVSQRFLGITLTNIGYISWDQAVSKAVKEQQPFIISYPRCTAAKELNQIAANILHRTVSNKIGAVKFFQRLLGRFC